MLNLRISHILSFCLLLSVLILPCITRAASVTLAWDPNTDPDLAGYKIYYGFASRDYSFCVDVANYTSCVISGLEPGETYYFAATAYDLSSNESDFSEEVFCTTPAGDSDGDGLTDEGEINIYGIDPNNPDTDSDGMPDGWEVQFGSNPLLDDALADLDGDGYTNIDEYINHTDPSDPSSKPQDLLENLIYNSSMEEGGTAPDYWGTYNNDLTEETGWIQGVAHTGTYSIKIENTTATEAGWYGEPVIFSEPYPHTLTLGGWAKSEMVASGGLFALDFRIVFEDGTYTWYYSELRFSPGTHEWENAESTVTFEKGVKQIHPYCLLYQITGTAWFDDVYVRIPLDTFIYNSSMEEGGTAPDYWGTYNNDLTEETGWIQGVAHTGTYSIKIENTTATEAGWYGEPVIFSEPYPHTLTLGGWAKSEMVASGGLFALDFRIVFEDGTYTWYYSELRFSPGTHEWENAESTVTFEKGVKQIHPYCLLYQVTGTAWFDDVYAIVQEIY